LRVARWPVSVRRNWPAAKARTSPGTSRLNQSPNACHQSPLPPLGPTLFCAGRNGGPGTSDPNRADPARPCTQRFGIVKSVRDQRQWVQIGWFDKGVFLAHRNHWGVDMRQITRTRKISGEKIVKGIKRATRKQYSSEEKIRTCWTACVAKTASQSCAAARGYPRAIVRGGIQRRRVFK